MCTARTQLAWYPADIEARHSNRFYFASRKTVNLVTVSVVILLLLDKPVLDNSSGARLGGITLLTLNLDSHALVLLERGGEVGLLGRLGGLGLVEGEDLTLGVRVLDCWCLVGLEFFEIEFLDEIG